MSLYKRADSPHYWYEFERNGVRHRGSTGTANLKDARDIETAKKNDLARRVVGLPTRRAVPLLSTFITDSFLPLIMNRKPRTKAFYEHHAGVLSKSTLGSVPMDNITKQMIEQFVQERRNKKSERGRKFAVASVNRDVAVLRRILNIAVEDSVIPTAPKIKLDLAAEQRRERVITPEEETAYLGAAKPLLKDVAILLFDLGLRPEELFRLKLENFRDGFCHVFYGKRQGSRRRIPCSERVKEVVTRRSEGGRPSEYLFTTLTRVNKVRPIDTASIKKQHRAALKKSQVEPFVLYSIRHTAITRWSKRVSPIELKHLAGHLSLQTTERYIHEVDEDRLRVAVLGVPA